MANVTLKSDRVRVPDSFETINRLYYARGWSDGLPIIPPTEERVEEMLAYTDRAPDEVIAQVPPKRGDATVEKVAINCVMAGCMPQYLPLVITSLEAMCEPQFNLYGCQATTHVVAPLVIVNGPVREELDINWGYNAFGQGWRSNATIGRALRLILMNVGGGVPGVLDRATFGHPGKYSFCVAENEEANPWEPLHVELGFPKEVSTVTVIGAEAPHNINDHGSTSAEEVLLTCAGTMATPGCNNAYLEGQYVLSLGPEHASTVAKDGWSKDDIRNYLYEHVRVPVRYFSAGNLKRFYKIRSKYFHPGQNQDEMIPIASNKDEFIIVVIGGAGKHSAAIPTFGETRAVTKPIAFKDGTPVQSVEDYVKK